jgi:hypothetical protein
MPAGIYRKFCLAFVLLVLSTTAAWATGPFGFEYGMTKDQIAGMIGKRSIRQYNRKTPNLFLATKAPSPHPAFPVYLLLITPEKGLVKITAVTSDIRTKSSGEQVKAQYEDIQRALVSTYGQGKVFDDLKGVDKDGDWMKALSQKEREFYTLWEFKKPRNHIETIALEAKGLNGRTGYVMLSYEFEGFTTAVAKNQKNDSVF